MKKLAFLEPRHLVAYALVATVAGGAALRARAVEPAATTLRPLHVEGQNFVDSTGKHVALHGVNIGGWLVTEGWMCGQSDSRDRFALEELEDRFGPGKAAALMNVWYDHWFTTADLDRIQGMGFNLIRVPFGYRNLMDAKGDWHRDWEGHIDFSRFDWVVREAGKRGIYVIFDYHVWPGQKDAYSEISHNEPASAASRAESAQIWGELAKHFKGDGTVAGFDLLNEPEGCPGDMVQRQFTDAIRAQDPDRIVIGEGMYYTNFKDGYWKNGVWSAHYPDDKADGTVDQKIAKWSSTQNIDQNPDVPAPVFIGEMKSPQDTEDSAVALAEALNKRGWSWAVWDYKAANMGGWASFDYDGSFRYDLSKDSYDSLYQRWSTELTQWQDPAKPKNYYVSQWWIDGYQKAATEG